MNESFSEIPFIQDNKAWYFLSVFYVRADWSRLVSQISHFYQDRKNIFCTCLISFSEDKGEQVEISLASLSYKENLKEEIEQFFLSFLKESPSTCKENFPYGKVIWKNYPTNTLLWNRFRRIPLTDSYIKFHQESFHYALSLLETDTSPDTFFSVCLYLTTKGLSCIRQEEQKEVLSDTLYNISIDIKNYGSIDLVKDLIEKQLDFEEIRLVLESYYTEIESEYLPELKDWLVKTKDLINYYGYTQFCSFICRILGLKGLHQLLILELVNTWYSNRKK